MITIILEWELEYFGKQARSESLRADSIENLVNLELKSLKSRVKLSCLNYSQQCEM